MGKDFKVTENSVVILGSLGIFAFVTIAVIALVYNRALGLKASESALELKTNSPPEIQLSTKPKLTK